MDIYIVKPGDSVNSIAAAYDIPADSIIYNNQIPYPYQLAIGQALLLSTGAYTGNRPDIYTNGYAYPFISSYVLRQTLPYLTELSIFSYGFTTQGYLVPPPLDESYMITAAVQYNTLPVLTLTPFDETGKFNNYLISAITNDSQAQALLFSQIIDVMEEKGYRGLNIDFEYILTEDKIPFVDFVWNARNTLNELGYFVSVALPPKISDEQGGTLLGGFDYALLGEAANYLFLMTYEYGYTYSEPMAVAPINQVRTVVEYAVSRIPREKLSLGIPNYGYDWPLPFQRSVTKAQTLGNIEAVQLAVLYDAQIQFDELAMSPFFYYTESGVDHVVWFEDVRSIDAKFDLVKEFNLNGLGYWQIMQLFRANWLLLADRFSIRKVQE